MCLKYTVLDKILSSCAAYNFWRQNLTIIITKTSNDLRAQFFTSLRINITKI